MFCAASRVLGVRSWMSVRSLQNLRERCSCETSCFGQVRLKMVSSIKLFVIGERYPTDARESGPGERTSGSARWFRAAPGSVRGLDHQRRRRRARSPCADRHRNVVAFARPGGNVPIPFARRPGLWRINLDDERSSGLTSPEPRAVMGKHRLPAIISCMTSRRTLCGHAKQNTSQICCTNGSISVVIASPLSC
jgi:hypothetical protein